MRISSHSHHTAGQHFVKTPKLHKMYSLVIHVLQTVGLHVSAYWG